MSAFFKNICDEAYELGAKGLSSEETFKVLHEKYPNINLGDETDACFESWDDGNVEFRMKELEISEHYEYPREA